MKKRIFGLDILRVIGVILIFCYHFTVEYFIAAGGQESFMVDLRNFFNLMVRPASISLFLISGYALMHNHEEEISLKEYFIRRFKGLYIPFYVAYTMMFFLYFFVRNIVSGYYAPSYSFIFTILGIDGVMNYIQPNFYMIGEWFMSCIVICYLLFVLLSRLINKYCWPVLFVLTIWCSTLLFFHNPFPVDVQINPLFVAIYFYIGMLLYKCFGGKKFSAISRIISMICFVLIVVFLVTVGFFPAVLNINLTLELSEILYAIMAITLFIALRDVEVSADGLFHKIIAYISKISWYMILTHHAIMTLYYRYHDVSGYRKREFIVLFMLYIILTVFAAELVMRVSNRVKKYID